MVYRPPVTHEIQLAIMKGFRMKSLVCALLLASASTQAFSCELIWTCPDVVPAAPALEVTPALDLTDVLACGIWPDGGCDIRDAGSNA